MRIIRKYPNRRLYDMERSAYITLEEVRQLVLDKEPFQVVDKRTGGDITRSVLLQIISEGEDDHSPVFTTEVLQQIIRFHGDALQKVLGEYLGMSVALFIEQKSRFQEGDGRSAVEPVALLNDLTKRNVEFWMSLFPVNVLLETDAHETGDATQNGQAMDPKEDSGATPKKNG